MKNETESQRLLRKAREARIAYEEGDIPYDAYRQELDALNSQPRFWQRFWTNMKFAFQHQ